ncbi:MAG: nucleoside recognition domain-containing protein [Planctomycetota bacterium]|jgi:spore maturation protein A
MLNRIWFGLLLIGIVYGFAKGVYRTAFLPDQSPAATQPASETAAAPPHPLRETGQDLTQAALDAAKTAVELCIVLIGLMALWLGMLRIARDAGLVDALAGALRPLTRWLFPDVPAGHPAEGALLMNISANVLGLGNAATPFGLKAMRELQTLNPIKDTASNAMATFLAINTSSVTLVPFTIIGLRVAAGSTNAASPLAGIICTTAASTLVAILVVRALARWPRYRPPQPPDDGSRTESAEAAAHDG